MSVAAETNETTVDRLDESGDLCERSERLLAALEDSSRKPLLAGSVDWPRLVTPAPGPSVWISDSHPYYEVVYLDRGRCVLVVDGTGYELREGDICIIPADQAHYDAPIPPGESSYTICRLRFIPPRVGFQVVHHGAQATSVRVLDGTVLFLGDTALTLVERATQELRAGGRFAVHAARGYLTAVVANVCRQIADARDKGLARRENWSDQVVREVTRFIENRFHRPDLTVADIAAHVAFSPNYLSVYFKERTGCSPYRYLLETRLQRGCELLATQDASVGNIARAVGFSSPYHFSATFKRHIGVSPTEYRNRAKERHGEAERPTDGAIMAMRGGERRR